MVQAQLNQALRALSTDLQSVLAAERSRHVPNESSGKRSKKQPPVYEPDDTTKLNAEYFSATDGRVELNRQSAAEHSYLRSHMSSQVDDAAVERPELAATIL